jgi:hypothetical protein
MRALFVVAALMLAISQAHSGSITLNLDGAYGRNGSCGIPAGNYPATDNYAYLTAETFRGAEWFCSFVWVHDDIRGASSTFYDQVISVISICYAEGEPFSRLLTIMRQEDQVTVTNATEVDAYDILKKCPENPK